MGARCQVKISTRGASGRGLDQRRLFVLERKVLDYLDDEMTFFQKGR